jgi:hypothetical protein
MGTGTHGTGIGGMRPNTTTIAVNRATKAISLVFTDISFEKTDLPL